MRKWSGAFLPLSILFVLLALTAWLRYATEFPDVRGDGRNRHDPDYIISKVSGRKLDATGNLLYTLVAEEIRHYPDDDTADLLEPALVYLSPTRPPVSIRAMLGHANSGGQRVDLWDHVELRRAAGATESELVARMNELTVLTDEERAFTKSRVWITQGNSWVQGVGLQADHKLQTYLLESQVTGEIESHFAREKPPR